MMSQFPDRRKWRARPLEDSQFVPPWLARPGPQPAPGHSSEAGIATYTTETLIGWRGWSLHHGKLVSLFNAVEWPFRRPLVVEDDNWHLADGAVNVQGIHALKFRFSLHELTYEFLRVLGSVYLWGRVIECELGYRAQYAYPRMLIVSKDADPIDVMELEYNYGVEVQFAKDETEEHIFQPRGIPV
jgi:hypothetical protein